MVSRISIECAEKKLQSVRPGIFLYRDTYTGMTKKCKLRLNNEDFWYIPNKIMQGWLPQKKEDLTGLKFNKLTVISRHSEPKSSKLFWLCLCECGNQKICTQKNLKTGNNKSCGCLMNCKGLNSPHYKHGPIKNLYNQQKSTYQRRCGIDHFQLSFEEWQKLTFSDKCYYCGVGQNQDCKNLMRLGIDRIDSNIGYIASNCVTCCTTCNYMKRDHSQSAFLQHVQKIYNHMALK